MTTESVRLYVKGVFLGFKRYELFPFSHYQSPLFRSQCAQYSNTSLIHINGVETKKDAQFYMGKRVAFVYRVFLFISSSFLFPCRLTTLSRALRFAASGVRSPELTVLPELYVSFSSLRDIEFWWLFHPLSFLSHGPMSLFPFCRSALSSSSGYGKMCPRYALSFSHLNSLTGERPSVMNHAFRLFVGTQHISLLI